MVPEAYRQKFRNWRKRPGQTFIEFAADSERLFLDWLRSKEIVDNFEDLKQLVLMENFKNNLAQDMRTHLDELKVATLAKAASISDEFVLSHKVCYKQTQG